MLIDKGGVTIPFHEHRMGDHVFEKTDIGLDPTNPELLQGAVHDIGGILKGEPPGTDLYQQRIVVRSDFGSGKGVAGVKTDTAAGRRAVGCQSAEIGGEVVGRIFSGYAALDGITAHVDGAL